MQRFYRWLSSLTLMALGISISMTAYHFPQLALNYLQALGSLLFWSGGLLLVVPLTLGSAAKQALDFTRTGKGVAIGGFYLVVHLILYGFILEAIFVQLYGAPPFVSSPFIFVSSTLLYPASIANTVIGMAFNPSLTILVPPIFDVSLSLFSIFVAVIIDILILANVGAVRRIGSSRAITVRARAYLVMPLTGIFLGASCCMSLPVLLSVTNPSLTALSSLAWVYYLTYFGLPVLAAVVLKLNLDLAARTASAAVRLESPLL